MSSDEKTTKSSLLVQHGAESEARWEALERERVETHSAIFKALEQVEYITRQKGNVGIAEVEDLQEKINRAYQKMLEYLSPKAEQTQAETLGTRRRGEGGVSGLEEHPLLDKSGMPIKVEQLDPEWLKALGLENLDNKAILDKAELQNQVKNKLQAKMKNALKIANKMKQKMSGPQPSLNHKQVAKMVVQYTKTLELLKKPILKIEAPAPTYQAPPPKPRPNI